MLDQLKKLRSKSIITIILAMLAITWQFLSYITIKDFVPMDNFTSIEVIIIYSSYIFLAILFFSILSLSFTAFRVALKYKSEMKQLEKETKPEQNTSSTEEISE